MQFPANLPLQVLCGLVLLLTNGLAEADKIGPHLSRALSSGTSDQFLVWIFLDGKAQRDIQKLSLPQSLISERSLARRLKSRSSSPVDVSDVPVDEDLVSTLRSTNTIIRHRSKWFNAVSATVQRNDLASILTLPFVRSIELVGRYEKPSDNSIHRSANEGVSPSLPSALMALDYGPSFGQVDLINVPPVHESGNSGQGVLIGVFDNGFRLLSHEVFDSIDIVATYDFVENKESVVPSDTRTSFGTHGIRTLSVIGGYKPGQLIGVAYGASFLLARTENDSSETPREEDNWVAAIEWADSIGVDVASTSLIYREFDSPFVDWTWEDMNGNTTVITRAADMAVAKGIVVVNAAGNFGGPPVTGQNTLGAPGDGDSVLTVGAVDQSGVRASFSSVGPTTSVPPRTKPDVMAPGVGIHSASSIDPAGYFDNNNGTSFACPLAAGVAALLLSANPSATPGQIADALRYTANNFDSPNNLTGWGVLDAQAALQSLDGTGPIPTSFALKQNYPNPFNGLTSIEFDLTTGAEVSLEIFSILGRKVRQLVKGSFPPGSHIKRWTGEGDDGSSASSGVYIYRLSSSLAGGSYTAHGKMILVR